MTLRTRISDMADDGPSLAEFVLILALIVIVATAALMLLGGQVSATLDTVSTPV